MTILDSVKHSNQMTKNIAVIIPAYNEEQSLPKVINDIPKELLNDLIVVNNASTDATVEVAKSLGCRVIHEPKRGYGQACLAGISALDESTDVVVFLDGDYADHGDQMALLVNPIIEGRADFVIGSRALGNREPGSMTPQAFYGNKLACFLMKLFWGVTYSDLGPFRAITFDALKKLNMIDQDFGWTIEMQIKAFEKGIKTIEVPVNYRKRIGKSKISGTIKGTFCAGEKIIRTIFKYRFSNS